ncbi:MAG: hypothetical protein ABIY52_07245 [Gemmatimonadaceae bacterium]
MRSNLVRRSLAPLALTVALALPAHAQERQLFVWSGRVDRGVQLTVRNNSAVNSRENNMQNRGRFQMASALPNTDGTLRVVVNRGRGSASVVQQPSAQNDYTAIVDVSDGEGGADAYSVTAYWMPSNNGSVLGNRGNGRGYGNGNNRRDNDDRRGNRDRRDNNGRGNGAYGNAPSLRWSGEVDSVIELVWRGSSVTQRVVSGAGSRNTSTSLSGNANYAQDGSVAVNVRSGRGRVEVVQQPSAQNRYTTIIRITDPEGGYGRYVVDANWQ